MSTTSSSQALVKAPEIQRRRFWSLGLGAFGLAFSPDSRTLAVGADDHTVTLWDVDTGKELKRQGGHSRPLRSLAFAQDGRTLATSSADGTVRLWETSTGKEVRLIKGYGETHRRGKANFVAILDALVENPPTSDAGEQAKAIRKAREAALADPEGKALGQALGKPVVWLKQVART